MFVTRCRRMRACQQTCPACHKPRTQPAFVCTTRFSNDVHVRAQICEAFGANRYPFPEEGLRQRQAAAEVDGRLSELSATITAGESHRLGVLRMLAASECHACCVVWCGYGGGVTIASVWGGGQLLATYQRKELAPPGCARRVLDLKRALLSGMWCINVFWDFRANRRCNL
jgi:hypothetical protein